MSLHRALPLALILLLPGSVQAGRVTGTVRLLNGEVNPTLVDFSVQALVGGVAIATGTQIPGTSSYVIDIDDTRLNPIDTRVTLNFQATGLDEVNLVIAGRTPGTAQQVIDPVMPKKVTYPPTCYPTYYPAPACCHHSGRCSHLFRRH